MVSELNVQEVIRKYRNLYLGIKPTYCKALDDKVYFNIRGFKHLIFKRKHRRDNETIYKRLVLIPLIVPVIRNCDEPIEIRKKPEILGGKKIWVEYTAIEAKVGKNDARVRVVIKKIGTKGKNYFQSIMKYN